MRSGRVKLGAARLGRAGRGKGYRRWHGGVFPPCHPHGWLWRGEAWPGEVRHGTAMRGQAWQQLMISALSPSGLSAGFFESSSGPAS